ncbi:hypothetical protein [Pseudarthrobacter sp. Y6]|uniref:hypothetical protein n=1 Tax=Pseudarthrobacter sp. Y6 TaxID=3418422 RepID=UPI003CEE8F15
MRRRPHYKWGICPILGWPRVGTFQCSPNYRSRGVFSRSISGAHGFEQRPDPRFGGGGNPGGSRHLGAGARACRGPGDGGAPSQPESRDDG